MIKEAAERTGDSVGDGTSTATVLVKAPRLVQALWRAVKRLERKRLLRMNDPTSRSGDQFVAYVHHLAAHADQLFAGFKP